MDLLSTAQKTLDYLGSVVPKFDWAKVARESFQEMADAVGQTHLLASALDSIKSVSFKPTIAEIVAHQAFNDAVYPAQSLMADLGPRLVKETMASFSQSQRLTLSLMEQVSTLENAIPSVLKQWGQVNLGISNIIGDLTAIKMPSLVEPAFNVGIGALALNLAEIGRTYKGYLADVVIDFGKDMACLPIDVRIGIPTVTSWAYVASVRSTVAVEQTDTEELAPQWVQHIAWEDRAIELSDVFRSLGPHYVAMWQGSWAVLDSDSPDRVRQAAHSGRELLMQILTYLAPDSAFDATETEKNGHNGRITRRMRVRKILGGKSESAVSWAHAVAKALEETYGRLVSVSHDRSIGGQATEQQVTGLLYTLGGLLSFIEGSRDVDENES